MAELFENAGTQFDPELVRRFAELCRDDQSVLHKIVAKYWLNTLDAELVNSYWSLNASPSQSRENKSEDLFGTKLLENMSDAVIYIDAAGRILSWNRGAERLTGISGDSIDGQLWNPSLLQMVDEKGKPFPDEDCPARLAQKTGASLLRRLTIVARMGKSVVVDAHAVPVCGDDGVMIGSILTFRDVSSETTLERRCMNLYDKTTKDSMTQVANRGIRSRP